MLLLVLLPLTTVAALMTNQLLTDDTQQINDRPDVEMSNPSENPGRFEGDIVNRPNVLPRNAVTDGKKKWPKGVVPYEISPQFNGQQKSLVMKALKHIESVTCVRFKGRTNERDYVYFFKDQGCYSTVGRFGGRQDISLAEECMTLGIILHECMHTLGFWHEQSRTDRDKYVKVLWKNIKPNMNKNFRKYSVDEITHMGFPYDIKSILHYGPKAFARSPFVNTLEPMDPKNKRHMGQRKAFSPLDIQKINKFYECSKDRVNEIDPQQQRQQQSDHQGPLTDKILQRPTGQQQQPNAGSNRPTNTTAAGPTGEPAMGSIFGVIKKAVKALISRIVSNKNNRENKDNKKSN